MRLMLAAALGAAALAATAGAVEGWRHSPDFPNGVSGSWQTVATRMPAEPPLYVTPECILTGTHLSTFENAAGSGPVPFGGGGTIPPGFTPVRAVRCGMYGDSTSLTATQSEIRDPSALKALVAAYRTTHIRAYVSDMQVCPAMAEFDRGIALVAADGVAIMPAAPRDTCDLIIPAVATATRDGLWAVTESVTAH